MLSANLVPKIGIYGMESYMDDTGRHVSGSAIILVSHGNINLYMKSFTQNNSLLYDLPEMALKKLQRAKIVL